MPRIRVKARRIAAAVVLPFGLLVVAGCGAPGAGGRRAPMDGVASAVNLLEDDQRERLEKKYGPHPD